MSMRLSIKTAKYKNRSAKMEILHPDNYTKKSQTTYAPLTIVHLNMCADSALDSTIQQLCPRTKYRQIGQGFCGSVWAVEGGNTAIKRDDGDSGGSLMNDYKMRKLVLKAADALQNQVSVCIPRWPDIIKKDSSPSWWMYNLSRFPTGYEKCNILFSERIPAFSQNVRDRLINQYCPTSLVAAIKANDADRDCLIRPYLGRRNIQNEARRGQNTFSLRNFPLDLGQAEDLGLPILQYAHAMAEMLAMMHWSARIDASDIEFVLAGAPSEPGTGSTYTHSFLGTHSLWILDFDCCKPLSMDDAGIEQAARAFVRNDPFFPRPSVHGWDSTLWIEFERRYFECSYAITGVNGDNCQLPMKFIKQVHQMF